VCILGQVDLVTLTRNENKPRSGLKQRHQVWRALGDPARAHWTLGTIALKHGFNAAAHFSRSFRARFGLIPRDYRAGTRSVAE
jgi:AraC-like DNA-binding protein